MAIAGKGQIPAPTLCPVSRARSPTEYVDGNPRDPLQPLAETVARVNTGRNPQAIALLWERTLVAPQE